MSPKFFSNKLTNVKSAESLKLELHANQLRNLAGMLANTQADKPKDPSAVAAELRMKKPSTKGIFDKVKLDD